MDLSDPKILRPFLDRFGLFARKGLGQHFLASSKVVRSIVERTSGCNGVLEIGPGPGVLTGPLSEAAAKMIALEVDDRMFPALAVSAPRAEIRKADALEAPLASILEELPTPRAVVSNLPYYITGPLLTRIAEAASHFDRAILMMQKEVGVRVLAPAGNSDRGSLSVFLQLQFAIQKLVDAPAGAFVPPPKVDSVVLELVPSTAQYEVGLFELVRKSFKQPRKTLANNLLAAGFERAHAFRAFAEVGIDERARPADLELKQWVVLHRTMSARP